MKRVFSFLICFSLLSCITFPSFASPLSSVGDALRIIDFGDLIYGTWEAMKDVGETIGTMWRANFQEDVCPNSDNHRHSFVLMNTLVGDTRGITYVCEYCGKYAGDIIQESYDDYVTDLPATGIDSDGGLIWNPTVSDLRVDEIFASFTIQSGYTTGFYLSGMPYEKDDDNYTRFSGDRSMFLSRHLTLEGNFVYQPDVFYFIAPITGSYTSLAGPACSFVTMSNAGARSRIEKSYLGGYSTYLNAGDVLSPFNWLDNNDSGLGIVSSGYIYFPSYRIVPYTGYEGDSIYSVDTRPTSISGDLAYYNISGDLTLAPSGQIVNETDNSVYNPVTDTTYNMDNWTYDYSDRSYNITTSSGDSVTVTYGDENITIVEGDTIYNVYYVMEEPEIPEHAHNYTSTVLSEATCTSSGSIRYTCTAGDDTYTETVPALGHDWQVKTHVATTYDDSGQVVTEGFTIYRCSRCGEEYRASDSVNPSPPSPSPGSSGGSGSGGGSGSSGDSGNPFSKLGELLGTVFGGLSSLLGAFLSKILDALISLLELIGDKLVTVVETILGFFDELPQIFSGFLDFLSLTFSWLPPEISSLLIFGVAAVVVIGIIKAFRR